MIGEIQQHENQCQRDRHDDHQPAFGTDQVFKLPAVLDAVTARWQLHVLGNLLLNLRDKAAEVSAAHVAGDVEAALSPFAAPNVSDLIGKLFEQQFFEDRVASHRLFQIGPRHPNESQHQRPFRQSRHELAAEIRSDHAVSHDEHRRRKRDHRRLVVHRELQHRVMNRVSNPHQQWFVGVIVVEEIGGWGGGEQKQSRLTPPSYHPITLP